MILGIGIDTVEVVRFGDWHSRFDLQRLFSESEIAYCRSNLDLSAQRFAARYAAREALFKALTSAYATHTIPFLTLCTAVSVDKAISGAPSLHIDWNLLSSYLPEKISNNMIRSHLSLSHTPSLATTIVILERA